MPNSLIFTIHQSLPVTPKFSGVPLTNGQPTEVSALGHCASKSWYPIGTNYSLIPSYSAPPRYAPSSGPIHSYLSKKKYENNALKYSL